MPSESCQECAYLVGHGATCSKVPLDPETAGWNAGLEAAAQRVDQMRFHARANQGAMETNVMMAKWAGVVDALDDAADAIRRLKK